MALLLLTGQYCAAQNSVDTSNGLSIIPASLKFNLDSGDVETKKIFIVNNMNRKMQFKVYSKDWLRDSVGGHAYFRPDTLPVSCTKWVTFDKDFIEVPPKSKAELNVTLNIPADVSAIDRMRWAMIFVETIEEKAPAVNGASITQNMRVGVHLYQSPPQLTKKEMQLISFTAVRDSVNQFKIKCKNTGDLQIESKMYIELSSLKDDFKTTIDGRVFPTFPGQAREFVFIVPDNVPKGKYNAIAAVDAGDDVPLEALQAIIEVK